jgi:hypothetical protein
MACHNLDDLPCYIRWLVEIKKSRSCIVNYSRILYTSVDNFYSEIVFKTLSLCRLESVYPNRGFSWLCLVHSGKFRYDISNQTTMLFSASFSNSLSTIHPSIRIHTNFFFYFYIVPFYLQSELIHSANCCGAHWLVEECTVALVSSK